MIKKQKHNNFFSILLTSLILAFVFVSSVDVKPAHAQFATLSTTIGDIPAKISDIISSIRKRFGARAYQQAIRSVSYKLAQDTALYIAAGGKGQKPLIFQDWKKYVKTAGDQVAGNYIANLTSGLLPVDICNSNSIKSKMAITLGITNSLKDLQFPVSSTDTGKTGCKLTDIKNNFAEAAKAKNFLVNVTTGFDTKKNGLGAAFTLISDAEKAKQDAIEAEKLARQQAGGDVMSKKSTVSGDVVTTSEQNQQAQSDAQTKANAEAPRTEDIFVDTLAVFANTLTKAYLQKLSKGYYPFRNSSNSPENELSVNGATSSSKALLAAFSVFSPERAAKISTIGEVDLFADMVNCPPTQYQTPYNCLLNDGMQQAIQQGLTVQQAIDKGFLDANMSFPETHNPNQPKLSLLNLRKLRFLRILPIGWEMAAEKIQDSNDKTRPLGEVVKCFDSTDSGCVFLRNLIDPKWVLALPQQYCRAEGYSNITENEGSASRQKLCVDLQSCIKEDNSGNCVNYGYCTRERGVWNLDGEKCDQQFATCQAFKNSSGKTLSILGSDINKTGCTQNNAGCGWYSTSKLTDNINWNPNEKIYLTNSAPTCQPDDVGSREIIPLEPGTNLLHSPNQTQTVSIKPYTYYTLSFTANDALSVTVTGAGIKNVSFSTEVTDSLSLAVSLPNRYAATFFNQTASSININFNNTNFSNIQLEEVSLADGKRALDIVATKSAGGVELLNISPIGQINPASPATTYKEYKNNRKLVFADAESCTADEVSAREYIAISKGENKVARLLAGDLCPAACDGMSEYLAMPTPLETLADSGINATRQSFVASKARTCSVEQVGCEEFTSVTTNNSAEQRKYFSSVQACVLDTNSNVATFYTWEGTETAGYQLKAWQLLKDGENKPCMDFSPKGSNPGSGSCSNIVADCELNADNSDCRVFLDSNGKESKRDITKIVTASKDCTSYRRTKDNNQDQIWYFLANESRQCAAQAVGCREYKGARSNIIKRVLFNDFEQGNGSWENGIVVSESYNTNGKSYKINQGANDIAHVLPEDNYIGKSFLLKFDAKASDANAKLDEIRLKLQPSGENQRNFQFIDAVSPKNISVNWQNYVVGPIFYEDLGGNYSTIKPILMLRAKDADVYVDNIQLLQVDDRVYALEQSTKPEFLDGNQPNVCYNQNSGTGAVLTTARYSQCEAYRDNKNNTFYVSRFDRIFDADSAFCQAVIDTQNSDSPTAIDYNKDNTDSSDDITVPADRLEYRIIKPENLRVATVAGCTELGAPKDVSAADGGGFITTYRQIDPDKFFAGALCKVEGLGCQAFQADSGGTFVFRNPESRLCEWSANSGKFYKLDANGNITNLECPNTTNTNNIYDTNWVAKCPVEQSGCTAYLPVNPDLGEGSNTASFFIKDSVETGKCSSSTDDIAGGCVRFTEGYSASTIRSDNLTASSTRSLMVKAGRQCAEWLTPVTTSEVNDLSSRTKRTVSYDLGRCQELDSAGRCSELVAPASESFPKAYGESIGKLQVENYQNRFSGNKNIYNGAPDYSGYSIPNQYPLEMLVEDASGLKFSGDSQRVSEPFCRSFPEEDSPFSSDKLEYDAEKDSFVYDDNNKILKNVNKCEPGDNCQCSYKKITTTESEDKYYSINTTKPFAENTKTITNLNGWQGYCVEWDKETTDLNGNPACLTWWPVDVIQTGTNVFDNHPEAGYSLSAPQYFCLQAQGNNFPGAIQIKNNNYFINSGQTLFNAYYENNSGLLSLDFRSTLLNQSNYNFSEYDLEAIILKVREREHSDWPAVGEEIILKRDGFAKSPDSSPATNERWSAFWCTSKDGGCDFNSEYTWDKFLPIITNDQSKCSVKEKGIGDGNLLAVRAVFADENGKAPSDWWKPNTNQQYYNFFNYNTNSYYPYQFLGLEGGECDSSDQTGGVKFDVIFQLREWCKVVAQIDSVDNKAWTGRLNQKSDLTRRFRYIKDQGGYLTGIYATSSTDRLRDYKFTFKQDSTPFGAMVPPAATINFPNLWDSRKDTQISDNNLSQEQEILLEPGKQPIYVEEARKQVRAGSPYSCNSDEYGIVNNSCVIPPTQKGLIPKENIDVAKEYLLQLFAKVKGLWTWSLEKSSYQPVVNSGFGLSLVTDFWDGELPMIKGSGCLGSQDGDKKCIDVSNVQNGVVTEFYAYNSNGEQLPLKRIRINWGDGLSESIINGNWKNHKQICNKTGGNYGDTDKACETNKFKFNHIYNNLGETYTIQVCVMDNWNKETCATKDITTITQPVIPEKINGGWSEWSACSKDCGGGTQSRTCTNPVPANGGSQCLKDDGSTRSLTETRSCNIQACPVNAAWSGWSDCSKPCGNGSQTRICQAGNSAGTQTCTKNNGTLVNIGGTEAQICNTQSCPVSCTPTNKTWSSWVDVTSCGEKTCEQTTKTQRRTCQGTVSCGGTDNCGGETTQTQTVNCPKLTCSAGPVGAR